MKYVYVCMVLLLIGTFALGPFGVHADEFTSDSFVVLDPVIKPSDYSSSSGFQMWSTMSEPGLGTSSASSFNVGAGFLRFPFVSVPVASATAGDTQVALSWTAAEGFLGWTVSGYTVGQSTVSGGPYSYTSVGGVTTSTRTGLTNGTAYYFVIVVNDFFGNRIGTSTEVSATPTSSGTPPPSGGGGGGGGVIVPVYIPSLDEELQECARIADLNCDGYVDIVDFSIMYYWFDRNNPPKRVDLNKDGTINIHDFSIMAYYWYERPE